MAATTPGRGRVAGRGVGDRAAHYSGKGDNCTPRTVAGYLLVGWLLAKLNLKIGTCFHIHSEGLLVNLPCFEDSVCH
jgi:hypothetical protein